MEGAWNKRSKPWTDGTDVPRHSGWWHRPLWVFATPQLGWTNILCKDRVISKPRPAPKDESVSFEQLAGRPAMKWNCSHPKWFRILFVTGTIRWFYHSRRTILCKMEMRKILGVFVGSEKLPWKLGNWIWQSKFKCSSEFPNSSWGLDRLERFLGGKLKPSWICTKPSSTAEMFVLALRGALLPEESDDQVGSENIFFAQMALLLIGRVALLDFFFERKKPQTFCHLNMFQSFAGLVFGQCQ